MYFNMIMPATVGDRWYIGIPEIGSILLFAGLFCSNSLLGFIKRTIYLQKEIHLLRKVNISIIN